MTAARLGARSHYRVPGARACAKSSVLAIVSDGSASLRTELGLELTQPAQRRIRAFALLVGARSGRAAGANGASAGERPA